MSTDLAVLPTPVERVDDLAQIIGAYNNVTEKLRASHESLSAEIVRLQQELASTDAQLQRSRRLAALGEMAAGIAHEVRNPLAAIQLFADVLVKNLAKSDATAESADTARKIASAVKGLDAVVGDVLAFAREMKPTPIPLDVDDVFQKALVAFDPSDQLGQVAVRRLNDPATPLAVLADPTLLHQVMLNLMRNAVDAMAEDGGTLSLDAASSPDTAGQVVLVVRDTGPGICDESIDRIFNPFFTTRATGTGLGLAIVHRIVDAHGGSISVHNEGGAVFEIRLPAAGPEETSGGAGRVSQ